MLGACIYQCDSILYIIDLLTFKENEVALLTLIMSQNSPCLNVVLFFNFFALIESQMIAKMDDFSFWSAQQPNESQNVQH